MIERIPFPAMKRPLIAILRGIKPEEVEAVVANLIEAGITAIEIPLNSPEPFRSIEMTVKMAPTDALIGAGTVLDAANVDRLHDVGGRLLVTPNVDVAVLGRAVEKGMVTMPGVFTATEALLAARTGATGLKFFPASLLGPSGINAIRAVLPPELMIAAVGGVSDKTIADYVKGGILSFGLGTSLFKPGMTADDVRATALAHVRAYDAAIGA